MHLNCLELYILKLLTTAARNFDKLSKFVKRFHFYLVAEFLIATQVENFDRRCRLHRED